MVPFALALVANDNTVPLTFRPPKIFISGPSGSDRQENKGMRRQVFAHVSQACSNSVFTLAFSSAYGSNLPKIQILNNFSKLNARLHKAQFLARHGYGMVWYGMV